MYKELADRLREHAEWAEANEWETPITLWDDLVDAAEAINTLQAELMQVKAERDGRCPVCNGKVPIVQDCDKWYSIEIEGREMSVWDGNKCVAIFSIEHCPMCGRKLKGTDKVYTGNDFCSYGERKGGSE